MKVYIIVHGWDHEGYSIHSVYLRKEDAEKALADLGPPGSCQYIEIEEHEVKGSD
jgi:hypothetical protein